MGANGRTCPAVSRETDTAGLGAYRRQNGTGGGRMRIGFAPNQLLAIRSTHAVFNREGTRLARLSPVGARAAKPTPATIREAIAGLYPPGATAGTASDFQTTSTSVAWSTQGLPARHSSRNMESTKNPGVSGRHSRILVVVEHQGTSPQGSRRRSAPGCRCLATRVTWPGRPMATRLCLPGSRPRSGRCRMLRPTTRAPGARRR